MSKLKIIFLDIDGVLNNSSDADHYEVSTGRFGRSTEFYSLRCVELLNTLIKETDAKVVVSSTWRMGKSDEEMQDILNSMGVVCTVIGCTDVTNSAFIFRGNEILKWLQDHEDLVGHHFYYKSYVIIDDDSDMLLWQKDNYVNTDPEVGMTERTVFKAKAILNNTICEDIGQEYTD